jgi:hypothetical protein
MKQILSLFISLLVFNQWSLCSSVKDSSFNANKIVAYKFNRDFTSLDSVGIDTTLKRFQIYSTPFKNRALPMFLGNPGLPYKPVLYSDWTEYPDFLFAQYLSYDFHKPEDIIFYRARSPYTQLTYFSSGPKSRQEQRLTVQHTQNINRNINVGFLGDLNYSDGQYVNQLTKLHAFSLFAGYNGQRYRIYGSVNSNSLKLQENGGVQSDSLYFANKDAVTVPVNLEKADAVLKNQSIFIYHRFYLTGSYKTDSLHSNSKWNEVVSLIHSFRFDRNIKSYHEVLSAQHDNKTYDGDFYTNFYINPNNTNDSAFLKRYENKIQLAINTNQWLKIPAELRFGLKNQMDKYSFTVPFPSSVIGSDTVFGYGRKSNGYIQNNSFVASLTNSFSKTIRWDASAEYYFTGYKANDIELHGNIEKTIWENFVLKVSGKLVSARPGYFINEYCSNNIKWNNTFAKQKSTSIRAGLYLKKFKVSVEAQSDNLFGYIYFNSLSVPIQTSVNEAFVVSSLTLNKLIDWGLFHTDIRVTFQHTGNEEAVSLPHFSAFNSTYFEHALFKKVLKFQIGFDVFYNSPFYADAYMPVTGLFYSQKSIKMNDYPFTNVFLNIKVKRLRFSIEYERITPLTVKSKGFFIPHYPYNPGILKYGLSWTFYD